MLFGNIETQRITGTSVKLASATLRFIRSLAVAIAVFVGAWLLIFIGLSLFLGSVLSPGLIALGSAIGAFNFAEDWFEPFPHDQASESRTNHDVKTQSSRTASKPVKVQENGPQIGFRATTPDRWVKLAYWPTEAGAHAPHLHRKSPGRNAGQSETSCLYISPLLGRTVLCESQHERTFFQKIESSGLVSAFVEQPVGISYLFEGRRRRYWPDAVVLLRDGRELLVEVKPRALFGKPKDMAKWRAAALWCHRNSVGFAVVDPVRGHILGHTFAQRLGLGAGGSDATQSLTAVPGDPLPLDGAW